MSKAHYITPLVPQDAARTVRLGTNAGQFAAVDQNKFVKFANAESEYVLCAAGDPIEAIIASVDTAKSGGFSIGSIYDEGSMYVMADGLEATPGTGTIAVGDYVVCGTVTALGTAVSLPKVCKATNQPGATVTVGAAGADTAAAIKTVTDAALAKMADATMNSLFAWRVESLGTGGVGTVGATILITRVE